MSYLELFSWKYYFGYTTLLHLSTRVNGHHQSFSQSQQKLTKKSLVLQYSFSQNTSFILWTLTHLTLKIIFSDDTAKILSEFANFSANIFLFNVRENICTAPFLDAQELHSWSTLKEKVCIFLDISLRKCLFERRSKIFSGGGGLGVGRINFLKAACCLGLAKFLAIFILF